MTPEVLPYAQSDRAKTARGGRQSFKSLALWALAALNVVLVVFLVNKFLPEQKAVAQVGRPSDYLMVPGEFNGVSTGLVFIIDTSKGELSAMTYDDTTNAILVFPKIDLAQVFKAGQGIGNGNKQPKPR